MADKIDCDADPMPPEKDWKVEEHQKGGHLLWDQNAIELWRSPNQQQNFKVIEGNKLREELVNLQVLNANVLDYLLANPHLIPEEWKSVIVFFWGTVYRDSGGNLCVQSLQWLPIAERWIWSSDWLENDFGWDCPALVSRR